MNSNKIKQKLKTLNVMIPGKYKTERVRISINIRGEKNNYEKKT